MTGALSRRPRGPLRTLLGAWLLVGTAGWAFTVAIAVYGFHRSGAAGVAVVTAARLLPAMLAAPVSGGLIDRIDRARVVVIAGLIETASMGAAAGLAAAGAPLGAIMLLAASASVAATAPRPALQALMPALASSPSELTRATAIWGAVDNVGFLLGGGLAGVAIAAAGTTAVMACAATLLALASLLAARLPPLGALPADHAEPESEGFASALSGVRALTRAPMLRAPFALFAGLLVLEGITDVQIVTISLGKLGLGDGGPGLLYTVWGVGGLLGSALLLILVRRRGYGLALALGALGFAAGIAVVGADGVPLALGAMIPAGLGFALV